MSDYPKATDIHPMGFKEGSHAEFEATMNRVRQVYRNFPGILAQWEEFALDAPDSDDVNEYLTKFPEKL
jgi:hypothetical protein